MNVMVVVVIVVLVVYRSDRKWCEWASKHFSCGSALWCVYWTFFFLINQRPHSRNFPKTFS